MMPVLKRIWPSVEGSSYESMWPSVDDSRFKMSVAKFGWFKIKKILYEVWVVPCYKIQFPRVSVFLDFVSKCG